MKKWEYMIVRGEMSREELFLMAINGHGKVGWRVHTHFIDKGTPCVYHALLEREVFEESVVQSEDEVERARRQVGTEKPKVGPMPRPYQSEDDVLEDPRR